MVDSERQVQSGSRQAIKRVDGAITKLSKELEDLDPSATAAREELNNALEKLVAARLEMLRGVTADKVASIMDDLKAAGVPLEASQAIEEPPAAPTVPEPEPDQLQSEAVHNVDAALAKLKRDLLSLDAEAPEARAELANAIKRLEATRLELLQNATAERAAAILQQLEQSGISVAEMPEAPVGEASMEASNDEEDHGAEQPGVTSASEDAIRPGPTRASSSSNAEHGDDFIRAGAGDHGAGRFVPPGPLSLRNGKFVRDAQGAYRRDNGDEKVCFVDEVQQIRFIDKQKDTFEAVVDLAKSKGWTSIEVSGSERFRSEAWFVARSEGLEVSGYEPKPKDLDRLAKHQAKTFQPELHIEKQEARVLAEKAALGAFGRVQSVDEDQGRYSGPVVYDNAHYVVQDIGRGVTVVHDRDRLPAAELHKALNGRSSLSIQYNQGQATCKPRTQDRGGAELAR